MIVLNSKSTLDCAEEIDIDSHNNEMIKVIDRIVEINNFDCVLICKYQDKYHERIDQKIYSCKLSEIWEEIQRFDLKNGIDLLLDDDNYLVLMIYGQGYIFENERHLITLAVKILPYTTDRKFVDISNIALNISENYKISKTQFDHTKTYH